MYYLFGHRLGTMGYNATHRVSDGKFDFGSVMETSGMINQSFVFINPSDFVLGENLTTLINLKSGDVLTNRSGDTLEVLTVSGSLNITGVTKGKITIISGKYKGEYSFDYNVGNQYIYTSVRPTADEQTITAWLDGSYMFTATDEEGSVYIGHPTRVHRDYIYISANDTSGGIVKISGDDMTIVNGQTTNYIWSIFALFCAREITTQPPDNDPLKPGGDTKPGGGNGDFNGSSDNIPLPNLPHLSAVNTGFITLFNPTLIQLRELSDYMWSDLFSVDTLKKLFANPMDAIIGLSIVPVNIPYSGTKEVRVGSVSTGISMNIASNQYVSLDCGSLNVSEFWGAYLDYDPYTKLEIYLPYIGIRRLSTDDVMGKTVNLTYHVDILTGSCCAIIRCNDSVIYSFTGQCSTPLPINGNDWTNVINGALGVAGSVAGTIATGGALAPMVASSTASAVNSAKPNVDKSGNMSGTGGMLGVQTPYLILTRPKQAKPSYQSKYMGYPSFVTSKLGNLSGYTEIESIRLENIPATREELAEIETMLKSGVIF